MLYVNGAYAKVIDYEIGDIWGIILELSICISRKQILCNIGFL